MKKKSGKKALAVRETEDHNILIEGTENALRKVASLIGELLTDSSRGGYIVEPVSPTNNVKIAIRLRK